MNELRDRLDAYHKKWIKGAIDWTEWKNIKN